MSEETQQTEAEKRKCRECDQNYENDVNVAFTKLPAKSVREERSPH